MPRQHGARAARRGCRKMRHCFPEGPWVPVEECGIVSARNSCFRSDGFTTVKEAVAPGFLAKLFLIKRSNTPKIGLA